MLFRPVVDQIPMFCSSTSGCAQIEILIGSVLSTSDNISSDLGEMLIFLCNCSASGTGPKKNISGEKLSTSITR